MIFQVYLFVMIILGLCSALAVFSYRYGLEYLLATYISFIIAASFLANKFVSYGPFEIPSASIIASATFFITDLVSELWGKKESSKIAKSGLVALGVLVVAQYISQIWPCSPSGLHKGMQFDQVLGMTPRIILASFIAFIVSQHVDIYLFH